MNPKTCLIAGCLPLGIGSMLVMLMAAAFLGLGGGGEGEDVASGGGSNSAGGRWTVVKLPDSWVDFYSTEKEREDLRLALQKAVDDWQLPADEFLGVLHRESSGNPKACGPTIKGKNYYAEGLAQLIPETAERLGVKENERCNPVKSVGAAGQLLDKGRTKANNGTPLPWGSLRDAYFTSYNPGAKGTEEYIWDGRNGKDGIKQYAEGFVIEGVVRFTPDSNGRYWQMLIDEAISLGSANGGAGTLVDDIDGVYSTDSRTSNQKATCAGSLSKMMVRVQKKHGGYSPEELIVTQYRCIDLFKALVTDSTFKARVIAGRYSNGSPFGETFGQLIDQNKIPYGALVFTIAGSRVQSGDGDHVFMFLGREGDRIKRANGGGPRWKIDYKTLNEYRNLEAIVVVPDTGIWSKYDRESSAGTTANQGSCAPNQVDADDFIENFSWRDGESRLKRFKGDVWYNTQKNESGQIDPQNECVNKELITEVARVLEKLGLYAQISDLHRLPVSDQRRSFSRHRGGNALDISDIGSSSNRLTPALRRRPGEKDNPHALKFMLELVANGWRAETTKFRVSPSGIKDTTKGKAYVFGPVGDTYNKTDDNHDNHIHLSIEP